MATHYAHTSQIFQSEFKGRKVAVKIIRLHVPQKLDEPFSVSPSPFLIFYWWAVIDLKTCDVEVLQRGCSLETPSASEHSPAARCDATRT